MVYKCKICGGDLELADGSKICVCTYCGTRQTLPRLDEECRINLYERAGHLFRSCEFDKAAEVYGTILEEDSSDAEAYWSLLLCKYGIEYVDDPGTHRKVPTCNRTQFTSIFADEDYKAAIRYADESQKELYEKEAEIIEGIQKNILSISEKEEPFDVFICYKETDNAGRRTPDSVLAQELYYELIQLEFRVFFSRITLEDKPGTAYEPYIFAALHSAKVMVVLGTRAEYFQSPWVKNEWSRYLTLIKKGEKKILIPAFRDMDAYELPEEFSHLQAQDMSKLGFMLDLVHGIQKITAAGTDYVTALQRGGAAGSEAERPVINPSAMLERAFMCLEDKDWEKADELLEQVLNQEPKNARAYLGKMMIELKISTEQAISQSAVPLSETANYAKVLRFGDAEASEKLRAYNEVIIKKSEEQKKYHAYVNACHHMEGSEKESLETAIDIFNTILDYKDSRERLEECTARVEEIKAARRQQEIAKRQAEEEEELINEKWKRIVLIGGAVIVILAFCYYGYVKHQEVESEKKSYVGMNVCDEYDMYNSRNAGNNLLIL